MMIVKTFLYNVTGPSWSDEGFPTFAAAFVAGLFFSVMVQIQALVQARAAAAPSSVAYSIHSEP